MAQLELFAQPVAAVSTVPTPASIRARMGAKLAELVAADRMPWSEKEQAFWRLVWPQMSGWLPDEERADLIRRYEAEIARLTAAA